MSSRNVGGRKGGNSGGSSSTGIRRCELCGCLVQGNDQAWQTHTTGIRHRRNLASQRVFGEPGRAVVSTFEHIETAPPPTYQGKDVVLLAAQQRAAANQHDSNTATAAARSHQQARGNLARPQQQQQLQLQQLQKQLRKHLATQVGVGSTYSRAVERFSLDALAAAWTVLAAVIAEQQQGQHAVIQQQQQREVQPAESGEPVQQPERHANHALEQAQPTQQQQQQERPLSSVLQLRLCLQESAHIACLAQLLPPDVTKLHLTVPYQTYGPGAAATSAAVACFACNLSQQYSLQHLELHFQCDEYSRILQQGGGSMARLPEIWGKTLTALTAAMQVNCGLLRVVLAAYPGQFPPDSVAQLQTCLATSRKKLRLTVLLATHPRLGAGSPLAQLPHEVLAALLDRAVPRHGCTLHLELPQGLAGDSSSSSDEDDSSSESESNSDEPGSASSEENVW